MTTMRTCISCGDPVPDDKRKDAKYCKKAACRGIQYRKRQAEARAAEGKPHRHAGSTVLTCACGRRYKIQICALDEPESKTERAQSMATPQAITETVLPTAQGTTAQDMGPEHQAAASKAVTQAVLLTDLGAQTVDTGPALAAEAATQAVLLTDQRPAETSPATSPANHGAAVVTQTDPTDRLTTNLVTIELYFTKGAARRLPFHQAVYRRSDGRWVLHPLAQAAFRFGEASQFYLGGKPSPWSRYYGGQSPTEFGYDPDLVVMFWDRSGERGRVVSANLLRDILGDGWKAKLREQVGDRFR